MTRTTASSMDMPTKVRRGLGIAGRLTLAFAALACLAAIAGASSSWFSIQSAEIVKALGARVLPTVTASLGFAQQSSVLASEAPQLASESDIATLETRAARLDALLADQRKRLADLRGMIATASTLDPLEKLSAELAPKIGELKAMTADRIAIRAKIQKTVAQALSDYQDLMDFVRPLQEATQTAVNGEMPTAGAAAGGAADQVALFTKDLTTLRTVMDIQASGNLAFGMLSAAANAADESASDIRSQYNWAEVYIGKAMKAFGASDDGARMAKLVDALLSSGAGGDSVFALRAREIELDGKIAATLSDMVATSGKLAASVESLVQTQEGAARNAVEQSASMTRQNITVNAITSGLVIIAALLIGSIYVRRAVTGRLNALAAIMKRLASGDHAVVVVTKGHDEIAEMAGAVQVFKTTMIKGEELTAEAARLAQERESIRRQADAERAAVASRQAAVVDGLASSLSKLAKGDLTCDLDRPFSEEYESLRRDFNEAVLQLRSVMGQIVVNAESLRSSTDEISSGADDLSRRTENQAASLEETAAALDEVTGNVRKTADGAAHARDVVGLAQTEAQNSGEVMRQAVEAMKTIESSSAQIGQIIGVVDEIAFQTNLLALNAGVEAARAGDAGRGFAVVASEVRALAQRSTEAAKEIKALVLTSKSNVSRGAELVGRSGTALQSILVQVGEINTIVSEIATSAREQTHGLEQVNLAVTQMDQVTQQNAAMVEETTAASHNLVRDTDALASLIGRFRVGASRPQIADVPLGTRSRATPVRAFRAASSQGGALRKAEAEPVSESWEEF